MFLSCTLGYALFYTCRLSLSVAKEPLLAEGIFTAAQLGTIGAALKFVYAFGKLTNGVIADHTNVRKFLSTGLLLSALLNLALGFVSGFQLFVVLWALNGWFQSMGAAPSGVALTHWFAAHERGTRYGIWCTSHSIGEGFSFFVTAVAVSALGWRAGFWMPGALCVIAALVLFRTLHDRPETEGLPAIEVYKGVGAVSAPRVERTVRGIWREQLGALRHPWVWVIALSSALMYVSRYGIDDWVIVFLKREKGYELVGAGAVTSTGQLVGGLLGSILAGVVSDRFFGGRRNWPTLACGILQVGSLLALYFGPPGHFVLDVAALIAFAFATGASSSSAGSPRSTSCGRRPRARRGGRRHVQLRRCRDPGGRQRLPPSKDRSASSKARTCTTRQRVRALDRLRVPVHAARAHHLNVRARD